LDTNTLSWLLRGDSQVATRLTALRKTEVLVPQPVVAEIEYGLTRMPLSARQRRLRERFDIFLEELGRAKWTDEVSRTFGRIKAQLEQHGQRLEDFDIAVAAHALAIGGTLVTEDIGHMGRVEGLSLESWRQSAE